jgi:FAD/FMN-containing dehydrogenase
MLIENKNEGFSREAGFSQERILIEELRNTLKGRVIAPDDADYAQARTPFYGGFDRHPAAIVRVADANDVSRLVSLARDEEIELAVRSGGHSIAGHSISDGGIVLDLSELRSLEIDPEARTAWAQTGLTTGEFTKAAGEYGLAVGFGDTGSVGIGGITLGGGVGFLARKHGLTIDSLLAAEVVTADGRILQADAGRYPDLFWALRGGGGNFGVVTRFRYQLHEVNTIFGGMLLLPATPEVIAGFIAEAEAAPEELSTIANIMPAPPMPFVPAEYHGKLILMGLMVYAGDVAAGQRALAPFRSLAEPIVDMLRPMRYPEMFLSEEGEYHPTAVSRTMFINKVDYGVAETILDYLSTSNAPMRATQLRVLGEAMARVPVQATAFAHRHSRIMANLAAFYNNPAEKALRQAWVDDFAASLYQGDQGAYVNFMGDEGAAQVQNAYPGTTWGQLAEIKARYDPTNFFHLNQNIPPSIESLEGERQSVLAMVRGKR